MLTATQSFAADKYEAFGEAGEARIGLLSSACTDSFESVADVRRIGALYCARVSQRARHVPSAVRELTPDESSDFVLILQVCGRSRLAHAGRRAELRAGDITIIDSSIAACLQFERKHIQLCLQVPRTDLEQSDLCWSERIGKPLRRSVATFLGSLLQSSFQHASNSHPAQARAMADALIGLIVAGWSNPDQDGGASVPSKPERLLERIHDYMLVNLHNDGLSPQSIAQAHGISERQLHRLFQTSGLSVCRWIRQSRLDRCAADLRDGAQRHRSITEIAFRWGFNDAAHFSRLFRAEFDEAPSDYRSSALSSDNSREPPVAAKCARVSTGMDSATTTP